MRSGITRLQSFDNASLLADQVFSGSTQIPVTSDSSQAVVITLDRQLATTGRVLALEIGLFQTDSRSDQTLFIRPLETIGDVYAQNARIRYKLANRKDLSLFTPTTGATLYIKKVWDMGGLFS